MELNAHKFKTDMSFGKITQFEDHNKDLPMVSFQKFRPDRISGCSVIASDNVSYLWAWKESG